MNNLIKNNRIYFFIFFFLTFFLFLYGKDIAGLLDAKWIIKYPKHLVFPLAKYLSGFVKWLMDDANFIIFSFRDFTRFIAWIIEIPYNLILALISKGFLSGQGQDAKEILAPLSLSLIHI